MGNLPRIAILGAGPAGLGAAWRLARQNKADAVVIEQRDDVGGNSGSFDLDGLQVDYGSHRLHPSCRPEILSDLRELLRDDLLDRPRHGRIRLRGRWIHFPLKPIDMLFELPLSFGLGVARDALRKFTRNSRNGGPETFASVLEHSLGRTICRDFYFPYAVKIWGAPPQELSAIQARRRVSAGSLAKMVRKAINSVPGFRPPGAGRFFYPRYGFGQISRAIADAARAAGSEIRLGSTVRQLSFGAPHRVEIECGGKINALEADYIWSTIPITALARIAGPTAPHPVIEASRRIRYRAMVLIYLVIEQPQFTPFDAHYFPETEIRLTRLSEPKNYGAMMEPADRTALCGELPCDINDEVWRSSDEELAQLAQDALARCGLPIHSQVLRIETRRLAYAYPIYDQGYEEAFAQLDEWTSSLDRVLTFGRQGLFAHDNTHHALAMAYAAVDCLSAAGEFDFARWADYRVEFAEHVVED
ncbi:MAG TPA: FAD-dependent oxidoreductase [Blastocatellia bacterium]|nr:FAD-dependent oxidoreductase [Blastocatellia bacterium]